MDEAIYTEPWQSYQYLLSLNNDDFEPQNSHKKLWWLVRKAQCENLLYFYSKLDETIAKALLLVDEQTTDEVLARLKYFQGLSNQRQASYTLARQYFNESMRYAKQGNFHHLYIKSKQELAYTHSLNELYETSLKDMQAAYVEAFALNDRFLIAIINETYGAIYGYMREREKSINYYKKALLVYESLGYKAHIAEAIYGMASTYRYWKKYDKAIELFTLYQQKISYTPNENITYFGAYGLGMSLAEKGECKQALSIIEQALLLKGLDDYDAELYKRQAVCFIQLHQYKDAEKALTLARNIFDQLPDLSGTGWQLEVKKISGMLAYAKGEYQLGYQLLDEYYQQYTNVLINNGSSRVANIRASMEVERLEVEKALSKQRSKAELLVLENQAQIALNQQYFIIFLGTTLLIVIVVAIYQFKNNQKMKALSILDGLSGLYNRRYTFNYLHKMISSTSFEKGDLSIFVFDIDNFKNINDTYGHPTGDKVIKDVAKLSLNALRAENVVGRIGGEEFMCVLPRADSKHSQLIAERMRRSIDEYPFKTEQGETIKVTASFGVAELDSKLQSSKELYANADKAMYEAKHSGKNKIIIFTPHT